MNLFTRKPEKALVYKSGIPYDVHHRKFFDALTTTKFYCDIQVKKGGGSTVSMLRSINPVRNGENIFKFSNPYPYVIWTRDMIFDNEDLVEGLFLEQEAQKSDVEWLESSDIKGKVLIAEFDESVTDGASEAVSDGFIDGFDLPPIDTWFYIAKNAKGLRRMYAWIPDKFVHLVDDAIAVNCVDCLSWLDESSIKG